MAIKTYTKNSAVKLSTNFKSTEFDCHGKNCCSTTLIDEKLIDYVQQIRTHFKKAVHINSGYRCAKHNASVGGASKSNHMNGKAADIRINGITPLQLAQYAESIGVLGIGVYSWGIHIDTRTTKYFWYDGGATNVKTFGSSASEPVKIDTSKINTSAGDPKVIWNFFKKQGLNDYGIAGLMGNLYAESGLKPINLQNTYEKSLNYTDAEYTAAVDQGIYTNFVNDKAGYGLAQWTYYSRKQALLDFHKKKNKSIGDLQTQLEFLMEELNKSYANTVLKVLKNATSLKEASNAVLFKFEKPANQDEKVQQERIEMGQVYYNKFAAESMNSAKEEFSNSPLVDYIKISPNKTSPRNHKIDTITIHCVVGQCSVETLGKVFEPTSRQASSNYGIGYDGKIGMYVEEKDRSWCSSSASNDNRAITIEVASDTTHPYAVNDKAYAALIELLVDICKRNDIKELKWKADKSLIGQVDKQNMTVHRWFANKSCPGDYLYERHEEIAKAVNKKLGVTSTITPVQPQEPAIPDNLYRVRKNWNEPSSQIGAYKLLENAKNMRDKAGEGYFVYDSEGNVIYPVVNKFPYLVKVTASALNVRSGAGTHYKITTTVKKNQIYTIVDQKDNWGKLKSGAGWICLDYTKKV